MSPLASLGLTLVVLLGFSLGFRELDVANATTAALGLLVVVLAMSTMSRPWVAVASSFAGTLCLNYFFVPPVGTLFVADAHNVVSLVAFVIVGVVASHLSMAVRARAREAVSHRVELARLFDLSRDVLLTESGESAPRTLVLHVARRFELAEVAMFLPLTNGGWTAHQGGAHEVVVPPANLDAAYARAGASLEFDARERAYNGQAVVTTPRGVTRLVPLRVGSRVVGLLAVPALLPAATADAVAGLAAIAVDRGQLLAERRDAALVRQRADLASALLASMSHDLRTPLTAIGVAVESLDDEAMPLEQRRALIRLASAEVHRLNRLFRDILDMARIEAAAVPLGREWVTPADIIDAACANLRPELEGREVVVEAIDDTAVLVDPRLTSAALTHLLENAAQYAPAGSPIVVQGHVDSTGLLLAVRDWGPGLDAKDLAHVFERFYRGTHAGRSVPGSGMGLAISRGLLAAEGGRVWAANMPDSGARFSIAVPAETRRVPGEV